MRKSAIIEINPDINLVDLKTGDISTIEILDNLKTLSGFLAKELVDEYCKDRNIVNKEQIDDADFEGYCKFLRNQQIG